MSAPFTFTLQRHPHQPVPQRGRRQRGATLIEVLVAFVLVSVGMVGILGMRLMTERAAADSNLRSTAAMHAQDMFERLSANPTRASSGDFNLAVDAAAPTGTANIAQTALTDWRARLASNLPSGTGSVSVTNTGTAPAIVSIATVTVQWTERAPKATTGTTVSFTFSSRL